MNALEIAQLKDNIMSFLFDHSKEHLSSEVIYDELNLKNVSIEVFSEYLKEMDQDDVIHSNPTSANRNILFLTCAGRKLLLEGGYVKRLEEKSKK
jgi:hypothetical protein